jgi:hypothetical protein
MRLRRRHVAIPILVALGTPAVATAAIHGNDGKVAFESSADIWVIPLPAEGQPIGTPQKLAGSSPTARDSRPAWAPTVRGRLKEAFPTTPVQPGDEVGFIFETLPADWTVTVRWPGLATESATFGKVAGFNGLVRSTVPIGARTGRPCLSVAEEEVVDGWPGRLLSPTTITVSGTTPSTDTVDGCSQPIAFQSDRAGTWDVWAYEPMSGALRNLTPGTPASDETAPAWSSQNGTGVDPSSDRTRPLLAYAGSGDIFVTDPLNPGLAPVNVTSTSSDVEANPDWSSFGGWLTFERERDGDRQLWVMPIDPGGTTATEPARRVTGDLGRSTEPNWFTWHRPGMVDPIEPTEEIAFDGPGEQGDLELHHVEAPLAPIPFGDLSLVTQWTTSGTASSEMQPAWSPRGSMLAFASDRPEGAGDAAGDFNLWIRPYDPAKPERLVTTGPGDDLHPAWQPQFNTAVVEGRRPRGRASRRKARLSVVLTPTPTPTPDPPTPDPQPRPRSRCTVTGTAGRDVLRGTPGRDVICGLGGADRIAGLGGDDVLLGGTGDDRLGGGPGRDRLDGGPGRDRLSGDAGRDRLAGGAGRDLLLGGAGADRIAGGAGRDRSVADRRDTVTQTERIRRP